MPGTTPFTSPAYAQSNAASVARVADRFAAFVAEASQRFGVPVSWIRAVMHAESREDAHAISPKGAIGLMQLIPSTWMMLRARHGLGANPYDPRDNILAGAAFLRELHDRYGSPGFLAAYNAGPGRYESYLTTGRPLPAETRAYVAAIAPLVGEKPLGGMIIAASSPHSWTRSSLFFVRNDGASPGDRTQKSLQANPRSDTLRVVDLSGIVPRAGNLFVQIFARAPAR
ncbi:MAG: lytic transglycosylase domain-containing protein [Methylovirgula sp.]